MLEQDRNFTSILSTRFENVDPGDNILTKGIAISIFTHYHRCSPHMQRNRHAFFVGFRNGLINQLASRLSPAFVVAPPIILMCVGTVDQHPRHAEISDKFFSDLGKPRTHHAKADNSHRSLAVI